MAIYDESSIQHDSEGINAIAYQPYYFDVHVFFSITEGYSIPVKMTGLDKQPTEYGVIQFCLDNNLFSEEGDNKHVDRIEEITMKEYKQMKS